MTPEENVREARRLWDSWFTADGDPRYSRELCRAFLAQALAAREAATVERCEKVAESVLGQTGLHGMGEKVASALRATLKPETKGEGK